MPRTVVDLARDHSGSAGLDRVAGRIDRIPVGNTDPVRVAVAAPVVVGMVDSDLVAAAAGVVVARVNAALSSLPQAVRTAPATTSMDRRFVWS